MVLDAYLQYNKAKIQKSAPLSPIHHQDGPPYDPGPA